MNITLLGIMLAMNRKTRKEIPPQTRAMIIMGSLYGILDVVPVTLL